MSNRFQPRMWKYRVGRTAAFLLGTVFLLAALSKVGDLVAFQKALAGYSYIPLWLQGAAIIIIPGLELVTGASLFIGRTQREAAIIATILLVGFLSLAAYNQWTGTIPPSCGCIKMTEHLWFDASGPGIIWRDLILLLLSIPAVFWIKNDPITKIETPTEFSKTADSR